MNFEWIDFYTNFADTLLEFKSDRNTLIDKIKKVYSDINIKLPTLETKNEIIDIDPFTVFGLFNKGITNGNRIKIINGIIEEFNMLAKAPDNFDGIPVLNNLAATFYHFKNDRNENDIENLWELFESALVLADSDTSKNRESFSEFYNKVRDQIGIRWNITMGLYWIRPSFFINLDSRNRWFIADTDNMPTEIRSLVKSKTANVPSADDYMEIRDKCKAIFDEEKCKYKNFPELSYDAWIVSEQVNREKLNIAVNDEDNETTRYWLYAPGDNAAKWEDFYQEGIMGIGWHGIGNLKSYADKNEMKDAMKKLIDPNKSHKNGAHATWQFANEIKSGDVVFVKKGTHLIIGRGVVESDYEYDESRDHYPNIRKVKWTHKGEWQYPGSAPLKTLTDMTPYTESIEKLKSLFINDTVDDDDDPNVSYPLYDSEMFLEDVYMSRESYNTLAMLVKRKKNVVLQGAPGVGKTYAAKRLAYSLMGEKDQNRVAIIQFHQSYSYEDFIMGFRPGEEKDFELKKGVFYNFCKEAEIDSDNDYFFIIDEINRGNLSKIFGELFMLIENDKRGPNHALHLPYSDEKFSVPTNVHIIGMMNTADRSLAMLDYALRRRFAFYEIKPAFDAEGFKEYQNGLNNAKFDKLINCVKELNKDISKDESLGEGFCIGHSYFCNLEEVTDETLSQIVKFELIPLLKEYWFDEPQKVEEWSDKLRSAIK